MREFRMKDFNDVRYPGRKPWLLILLVAAALIFLRWYTKRNDSETGVPEQEEATNKSLAVEETRVDRSIDADVLLAGAGKIEESRGACVDARIKYLEVLRATSKSAVRAQAERRLGGINIELVLTPTPMPEKVDYVVKRGDSVEKIARRYGTTVDLIQKSNLMKDANLIRTGDRLRIFTGKFGVTVSKSRNDLVVSMNEEFFKRYRVGSGQYDRTPDGTFRISEKIKEPVWWRGDGKEVPYGDPENILGTRWMTLRAADDTPDVRGYGIHGTWDDASIGKAMSAGCIRLKNNDVEQLYILLPLGTPVTITE